MLRLLGIAQVCTTKNGIPTQKSNVQIRLKAIIATNDPSKASTRLSFWNIHNCGSSATADIASLKHVYVVRCDESADVRTTHHKHATAAANMKSNDNAINGL